MNILNQVRTSQFAQKLKRPEGPSEEITGKNALNDTVVFIEKSAEFGTEMAGGLALMGAASKAGMNGFAMIGSFAVGSAIGKGVNAVGNLAGNTVADLTSSEKAGRLTRSLVKAGTLVGGVAALSGGLLPGVAALGISGLLYGAGQIFGSLVSSAIESNENRIKPESKTELDAPNLLSASAPSEFDAPNLLSPSAPSEFDAPNLLQQEADSTAELAQLNDSSTPKVLLQTA